MLHKVSQEGGSVTTLDISGDIMVTGSSDGTVQMYNIETDKKLHTLSQSNSMVYKVKIVDNNILITIGKA